MREADTENIYLITAPDNILDDRRTLLHTQVSAVKADIIVVGPAPLTVGKVLVVCGSLLILVSDALLRLRVALSVSRDDSLGTVIQVCIEEDVEDTVEFLEDVICAAAYDDAGLAGIGDLDDLLALDRVDVIRRRHAVHDAGCSCCLEAVGYDGVAGGILAVGSDIVSGEACLPCDPVNDLPVVVFEAEIFRKELTERPSSASKLSADSDDLDCHSTGLLILTLHVIALHAVDRICERILELVGVLVKHERVLNLADDGDRLLILLSLDVVCREELTEF